LNIFVGQIAFLAVSNFVRQSNCILHPYTHSRLWALSLRYDGRELLCIAASEIHREEELIIYSFSKRNKSQKGMLPKVAFL